MVAIPPSESIATQEVKPRTKRTRKSHPKHRTGCFTCKIRRKKCDESRPCCKRCSSTGRKCDGYPVLPVKAVAERVAASGLPTPPSSVVGTPVVVDETGSESQRLLGCLETDQETQTAYGNSKEDDLILRSWRRPASIHQTLPQISSEDSNEQEAFLLQLWRPPSLSLFATERDSLCFDFFRLRTGPEFSGYFDSSFWQGFLIQTCFSNPAIRQAAVALGAVHRRHELGITPQAFAYCDYSLSAYTNAMKSLREELRSNKAEAFEIGMISSMLFAAFETFQGNFDTAASHMLSGLKLIFSRKLKTISSASQRTPPAAVLSEANLRDLFASLRLRSLELFKRPAIVTHQPNTLDPLPLIPSTFTSLESAHDSLHTLIHWLLHALDHSARDPHTNRLPNQSAYIVRLLQWSYTYAAFSRLARKSSTIMHERPFRYLRLYREAAYLLILTHGNPDNSAASFQPQMPRAGLVDVDVEIDLPKEPQANLTVSDAPKYLGSSMAERRRAAMNAHFSKLLVMADSLVDVPSIMTGFNPTRLHSFSVDSGIAPALCLSDYDYPAASRSPQTVTSTGLSNSKIRPQALSLLRGWSNPGGVGDETSNLSELGSYSVAEKLTAMEDQAVMACGALPRHLNARWVDVTIFLEERKVLMRYCTPDVRDGGLLWTQEWVSF